MPDVMQNALTREEWQRGGRDGARQGRDDERLGVHLDRGTVVLSEPDSAHCQDLPYVAVPDRLRHALAALALHDQPFGFTHEDVATLEATALEMDARFHSEHPEVVRLHSLAARIAALLPQAP